MKRHIAIMALLCGIFFCTSCGLINRPASTEKLVARPFQSNVEVTWCEETYQGNMQRSADGALTLTLSGKHLGEPLIFYYDEGGYGLEQGELAFKAPKHALLSSSLLSSLERAFVMLHHADVSKKSEEVILQAGTSQLRCNKNDGKFITLMLDKGKIQFVEFVFSDT